MHSTQDGPKAMISEQTTEQSMLYQAHKEVREIMLDATLNTQAKTSKILSIIDKVAWSEAERGYDIGYEEAKHWYKAQ